MIESKIVKELIEALTRSEKKTSAYDTVAEVVRVEDDVAWVHIPGGVDETPVQMSVNSRVGDTVRVRVSGGQAWLMGNDTAPPTDDKKADKAQETAEEALLKINTIEAIDIFANMIEVGTLSADYIEGGTLKIGGTAAGTGGNGIIDIYNSSNTRVGRWNSSGLTVGSNSEFQVDMNGKITAKNADLSGKITLSNHSSTVWLDVVVSGSPDGALGPGMRVYYCPPNDTNIFWGPSLTLTKLSSPDWLFQGKYGKIYDDGHIYLAKNDETNGFSRLYARTTAYAETYASVVCINRNNNMVIGEETAGKFSNMNFYVPSGGRFYFNTNIALASGATVDGVDVSELANAVTTDEASTAVSVPNESNKTLLNTGSMTPGVYLLKGSVAFAERTGGRRALFFSSSSDGTAISRHARVTAAPVVNDNTRMEVVYLRTVTSTSTLYLNVYQDSGSALNATAGLEIIKLHA